MQSEPSTPQSISTDSPIAFEAEVNELGLRALQVYQRQHEIADRLWSYFNQYSGLMVMLSLVSVAFRAEAPISELPMAVVLMPPLIYAIFFVGNHRALRLTVLELAQLKAVAVSKTRLRLEASPPGKMLLFHLIIALLAIGIYLASWTYICLEKCPW